MGSNMYASFREYCHPIVSLLICVFLAIAGAAATIASDALMNPFDGESPAALPHDPASDPLPARPPCQ